MVLSHRPKRYAMLYVSVVGLHQANVMAPARQTAMRAHMFTVDRPAAFGLKDAPVVLLGEEVGALVLAVPLAVPLEAGRLVTVAKVVVGLGARAAVVQSLPSQSPDLDATEDEGAGESVEDWVD